MCEILDGVMIMLLGIAAWGDWKRREISVNLLIVMSAFSIIATALLKRNTWLEVLFGVGLGLFFVYVSYLTGEKIGYGDIGSGARG